MRVPVTFASFCDENLFFYCYCHNNCFFIPLLRESSVWELGSHLKPWPCSKNFTYDWHSSLIPAVTQEPIAVQVDKKKWRISYTFNLSNTFVFLCCCFLNSFFAFQETLYFVETRFLTLTGTRLLCFILQYYTAKLRDCWKSTKICLAGRSVGDTSKQEEEPGGWY